MKKLPIGISTFSEIIQNNYYYVDKTPLVYQLATEGKYYFLSRPRRFGKSLLVDTIKEAFSGNEKLFEGLYLEKNWDWSKNNPVINISFGAGVIQDRETLDKRLYNFLRQHAEKHKLNLEYDTIPDRFAELIRLLYEKYNQRIVILIDEYDKPILDNITDSKTAANIREGLKNFYSVIKDSDAYIKFCLLTGVSKFSKVNLFSGLNNLTDISLDFRYGDICGYTEKELKDVFGERLADLDLNEIRKWYNGYNFLGSPIYNPYATLLYFDKKMVGNYWFESATPTFLLKLLKKKQYFIPDFESLQARENVLGSFDLENLLVETLLFQTGYLTIKAIEKVGPRQVYTLSYPNMEVKLSLLDYLLDFYVKDINEKNTAQTALYKALEKGDLLLIKKIFFSLFASIPHDWYRNNDLEKYEGYYASVVYACLASLGFDLVPEDTTNHGKIDLTLHTEDKTYIFEFKVTELVKEKSNALEQIKLKKYHEKYMDQSKPIYRIGIDFSKKERNITHFEWDIVEND
ncbi:MAG: ATP-binding protein [Proteobacteria bacterium]|nr:ATP-binding protein [Pseudomonadota bacterium]